MADPTEPFSLFTLLTVVSDIYNFCTLLSAQNGIIYNEIANLSPKQGYPKSGMLICTKPKLNTKTIQNIHKFGNHIYTSGFALP